MTKVTNNTKAKRGFNTLDGRGKLLPGESGDFDLDEALAKSIAETPGMVVSGFEPKVELTGDDLNADSFKRMLDAINEELATTTADLNTLRDSDREKDAEIERLTALVTEKDSRIGELMAAVTDPDAEPEQVTVGLVARHKGGGSYSVFDADDKELVSKLTKEQEIEFNGMDDAGKTQWVAIQLKNTQDEE